MEKKYRTHDGLKARILATDLPEPFPVAVAVVSDYMLYGLWYLTNDLKLPGHDCPFLVEVSPWEDFKVDDKVLVSCDENGQWHKRYFAGISDDGYPMTFQGGATSWSATAKSIKWTYCKKADNAGD